MNVKTLCSVLALGLFAAGANSQDGAINFDVYSVSDCGDDPNNLEVLSTQLTLEPPSGDSGWSECMETSIDLSNWPVTDEGKYSIWVDTNTLDNDCELTFYQYLDQSEQKRTPCGDLEVSGKFGYSYCCNQKCLDNLSPWKRGIEGPVENVAEVKRAPLLSHVVQRDDSCRYVKDEDSFTTYGPQTVASAETECLIDSTNCGSVVTHTSGIELTDGWNIQASVGIDIFKIVSVELSGGYEHSETEIHEFSVQHFAPIEDGHRGRAYFQPLNICGKGHFEGNCGVLDLGILGDEPFCVPKLLPGNVPDGTLGVITTD